MEIINKFIVQRSVIRHAITAEICNNTGVTICNLRQGPHWIFEYLIFAEYLNGNKNGIAKLWHPNGQIRSMCYTRNNKCHGEVIVYRTDGTIDRKNIYVDDVLLQPSKCCHIL